MAVVTNKIPSARCWRAFRASAVTRLRVKAPAVSFSSAASPEPSLAHLFGGYRLTEILLSISKKITPQGAREKQNPVNPCPARVCGASLDCACASTRFSPVIRVLERPKSFRSAQNASTRTHILTLPAPTSAIYAPFGFRVSVPLNLSNAARAASCSAAFFDRPLPLAICSPLIATVT